MCGIVGYVGYQESADILVRGLERLEYRGYDSAGVAVLDGGRTQVVRAVGKLAQLAAALKATPVRGSVGIGHTRWATHGRPSEENAHPHNAGPVTVVHNGIIENHLVLRAQLQSRGAQFRSETDTEILSHAIREHVDAGVALFESVRRVLAEVQGSYAIAVTSELEPDRIVVAKNSSPLIIGIGEGERYLASDIPALLPHTRQVVFLFEGEMAELTRDGHRLTRLDGTPIERESKTITWTPSQAEKGGHKHFMLKEIFEQPRAMTDTLRGRISREEGGVVLEDVRMTTEQARRIDRVVISACGTAWHAGLVGKGFIEAAARVPVEVDLASELRYRDPIINDRTLFIAVSQSGETADTLAALREVKARGARVLAVCNVIDSSIARASDDLIYTHAGPEIGVASTKAFMTQMLALRLFALWFAERRGAIEPKALRTEVDALVQLPGLIDAVLQCAPVVSKVARKFMNARDFLYLGRGVCHPIALEGALKLKEISYIHAEGYAAGEMKHGPIALIDEDMPVVVLAPQSSHYDKIASNLQQVRARDGRVIAVVTAGDHALDAMVDERIEIPAVHESLLPFVTTVPLQFLAYDIADMKGTDVDQPRNLAKSVTVE
jgi:glucosamine--fructose-6-phosphate aminotransferase (isomerizing)